MEREAGGSTEDQVFVDDDAEAAALARDVESRLGALGGVLLSEEVGDE
jgi:hypothetical protein